MIDASQLEAFARKVEAAQKDLKPYIHELMEKSGELFLDVVQAQIIAKGNVDTRKMFSSFQKGGEGNIFEIQDGGFSVLVGSSVSYAPHVNFGHKQQPGRFIPGYWEGNHFRYSPGAKSGMVLKADKVKGSKFFSDSVEKMQEKFPEIVEKSAIQFFRRYFS